jgi:hypothetical protein
MKISKSEQSSNQSQKISPNKKKSENKLNQKNQKNQEDQIQKLVFCRGKMDQGKQKKSVLSD